MKRVQYFSQKGGGGNCRLMNPTQIPHSGTGKELLFSLVSFTSDISSFYHFFSAHPLYSAQADARLMILKHAVPPALFSLLLAMLFCPWCLSVLACVGSWVNSLIPLRTRGFFGFVGGFFVCMVSFQLDHFSQTYSMAAYTLVLIQRLGRTVCWLRVSFPF